MKNIIFDFDGTLMDTAPLILNSMRATVKEMGLPSRSDDELRATIGLRLEEMPSGLWPDVPGLGKEFARNYRRIFERLKETVPVKCFPGVVDTLAELDRLGYRMAIASSRSHGPLEAFVKDFGIEGWFCQLIGGDDVEHGKPAGDPVLKILETQGWEAGETLTVGDATVDILMGKAAGTKTCAVTYGNGTPADLESVHPDFLISAFPDLLNCLRQ